MRSNITGMARLCATVAWSTLILFVILTGVSGPTLATTQPVEASQPLEPPVASLHVLRSDATGVVLELFTPDYQLAPLVIDGRAFEQLKVDGLNATGEAGSPQLPMASALLGVPPDARVTVRVLSDEAQPVVGQHWLTPAPTAVPSLDDLQPGELRLIPDAGAYASSVVFPAAVARLADDAWLRDQRLVRVEIYPFQYQPRTGQLTWHRRLRVAVTFERSDGRAFQSVSAEASPFDDSLRGMLLNYDQARAWRAAPVTAARAAVDLTPRTKIVVDRDGLYRLTYADLLAAGVDVTNTVPGTFHLTSQQQEVAIEVTGEADGHFDPGDSIVFYGQKLRGDILAARYASESDHWLTFSNGWRPTFNAQMVELYTNDNVYWLTTGGSPGLRMNMSNGTPSGTASVPAYYTAIVHAEKAGTWRTVTFSSVDVFFWEKLSVIGTLTKTYTTTLSAVAATPGFATVRAEIAPETYNSAGSPDHRVRLFVNSPLIQVADVSWDGQVRQRLEGQLLQAQLNSGLLTLTVNAQLMPGMSIDTLYFDWFEVEYARRFEAESNQLTFRADQTGPREYRVSQFLTDTLTVLDISNPLQPRQVLSPAILSGGGLFTATFEVTHTSPVTYFVVGADQIQSPKSISRYAPPDLSGGAGADYVIIAPREFITAVQPLADQRSAQGLRTRVIDVADIYNQYNDGIYHPIAIKNFLRDAYLNWPQPAPAYAVLVGDGHWNFKGYKIPNYGTPADTPIYMPPNLAWVDPWQGEVDSSSDLAAVSGNDILPDLAIGRLPVNNLNELTAVVSKTLAYEQGGIQPYQRRVTFVSDNIPDPKGAGDFVASSEAAISYLSKAYAVDRLYENDLGCPFNNPCPALNYALTTSLNLTGALFVNYTGHGSAAQWSDERVFVNADVPTLTNTNRLPILLSMTCLDGYWMHAAVTTTSSLAEVNVRAANGGAVAAFSPTGLGLTNGHDSLDAGFLTAIFSNGVQRLGPATLAAKLQVFATGNDLDLVHTFTTFGDPALKLPTYALTLTPAADTRAGLGGQVVTYALRVTNSAFMTDVLAISAVSQTWPVSLPTALILPPGEGANIVVAVTVPPTVTLGNADTVRVRVQSSGDATQVSAVLTTTANTVYGVALAPSSVAAIGQRSKPVTYTLRLTNTGNIPTIFQLVSHGPWASLVSSATVGPLAAAAGQNFNVYVQVPASATGQTTTIVTATAQGGSLPFATAALITAIEPYRIYLPLVRRS